jgi:hypothetical protein
MDLSFYWLSIHHPHLAVLVRPFINPEQDISLSVCKVGRKRLLHHAVSRALCE